jgi:hypothetical protein
MKFNASIAITGPLSTKWLDLTKDVADPVYAEARLFWDDSNKTYSLYNDDSSIKLPVGTQTRTKVYNNTGFDISSGKCVSITGTHANGNGYVALTDVTDDVSKSNIVGFTLSDIVSGGFGYVLMQGKLIGVNTSAFPNSTAVWLSITEPGGLQSTEPESSKVLAGTILVSSVSAGTMIVNIKGGAASDQFEIVTPIDSYFGTKYKPLDPASGGLYIEGNANKASGILINVPNNAGEQTWGGFSFIQGGVGYETGGDFILYGNDYFEEELRNNMGFYFTSDFYITGSRNTSNIVVQLGTTAQSYNTQALQETVLLINSDRTIQVPALTNALILTGGDQSLVTKKFTTDSYLPINPEYIDFNTVTGDPGWKEGRMYYDTVKKTFVLYNDESETALDLGEEQRVRVYNANGVTITNGAAVTVVGNAPDGSLEVELAIASDAVSALNTIGIATHSIEPGTYGWATTSGLVRSVDTSAYTPNSAIWLSDTIPGAYSLTRPLSPSYEVRMGGINKAQVDGSIFAELRIISNDQDNNAFYNGAILEPNNVVITSNGTTVNCALFSQAANNRLSLITSQNYISVTSGINIDLILGTDAVPIQNWVYIDPVGVMTVSTNGFPTGTQYTPVGRFVVQSALSASLYGLYKTHAYTDHLQGSNGQGHLTHLNEWVRKRPAAWQNGVVLTQSVPEGTAAAVINLAYTSGVVSQLHDHAFPLYNTAIKPAFVINDFDTPYEIANGISPAINEDSTGAIIGNNKYYPLVVWGVVSEETKDCKLFFNIPTGSYTNVTDAINDVDNHTDYTIPVEYLGTGFLITKVVVKRSTSTVIIEPGGTVDLRGSIPAVGGGSTIGGGGVTLYDSLTDTPITKVGASLKAIRVNVGETAHEYYDAGLLYMPIGKQLAQTKALVAGEFFTSYNATTGLFTSAVPSYFTPNSLLIDYGFTDNSTEWDTAYGWGDHSLAGYLTSETNLLSSNNTWTGNNYFQGIVEIDNGALGANAGLGMSNHKIQFLGNGVIATDAVNKGQLDGAIANLLVLDNTWTGENTFNEDTRFLNEIFVTGDVTTANAYIENSIQFNLGSGTINLSRTSTTDGTNWFLKLPRANGQLAVSVQGNVADAFGNIVVPNMVLTDIDNTFTGTNTFQDETVFSSTVLIEGVEGLSMEGGKISNLADGTLTTDAVNKGQMDSAIAVINNKYLRSDVADTFSGGTLSIDDGTGVSGNSNIISFATDRGWIGYNAGDFKIQASSGKGIAFLTDTIGFATGGQDMYLYQGQLGIGTRAPQAKLHVANGTLRTWTPTAGTSAIFESTVSNRNFVTLTGTSQAELWFGDATTQAKGRVRYEMASDEMEFWTAQAQKMVLASSGNLGIGTTNPTYRLDINGKGRFTDELRAEKFVQIPEASTTVNEGRGVGYLFSDDFANVGNDSVTRYLNHYGFGIHKPIGANVTGGRGAYMSGYFGVDIFTQGANRIHVGQDGKIGIGTTAPDGKLHIDGITSTLPGIVLEVAEGSPFNKLIEIQNTSAAKRFGIEYDNTNIRLGITNRSGGIIMSFVEGTKYVGIGKTNPGFPLDVVGEIHSTTYVSATDGLGVDSTSMSSGRGIALYGGPQLYPQYGLLFATTTNLGTHGSVTGDYATYFTTNATTGRGWVFKAGTINGTTGNVASISNIGAMTLNSTATATNFILSSDERLKENIQDFDYEQSIKIDVKTYELKSEKGIKRTGVIAQELEVDHPEFVRTDKEGMKSVAYTDLLMAKIAELEARLEKAGI